MKNTQKAALFLLVGVLVGALVLSCATGGGSAGGAAGETVAGTWEWVPTLEFSDGNDSTCFVKLED